MKKPKRWMPKADKPEKGDVGKDKEGRSREGGRRSLYAKKD